MSRKHKRSVVQVKFGPDFAPHTVAEFKRRGLPLNPQIHPTPGLIAGRLEAFRQTVSDVVPPATTVAIWPAIQMATTLGYVDPDRFGPDSGVAYTMNRGANVAQAKTLARADGSFAIVIVGDWFMNARGDSDDDIAFKSELLAHLAAHESHHIVLTLADLDAADVTVAGQGKSPTVNDFLPATAEAINEYQCELAANQIAVSSAPHDAAAIADDLAKFRESLASSVQAVSVDRYRACLTVLNAAKELVKGVAYAAAYLFYDGRDDRSTPDPTPPEWDRYMAELWPDLLAMFAEIPAAGEPIEATALGATAYTMAERVLSWLEDIGVTYLVEVENDQWLRSCWWEVPEPI